jgi:hypothetical protein
VARNAPEPRLEKADVFFDLSDLRILLAVWIVCPETNTVQHDTDGCAQQDDIVKTPDEFSHVRSATADKERFGGVLSEKHCQLRFVPKPVVPRIGTGGGLRRLAPIPTKYRYQGLWRDGHALPALPRLSIFRCLTCP